MAYHGRSLPLIWHIEPGVKGHTAEVTQIDLLQTLSPHFQPTKPVIFLGDSEFDGINLLQELDRLKWYSVCRTSPKW